MPCNLRLEATDFSLMKYSQENDLNNLVAARKHQKNPEKPIFSYLSIFSYDRSEVDTSGKNMEKACAE